MKRNFARIITFALSMVMIFSMFTMFSLTIHAEAPVISGDASRLKVEKDVYVEGEPIMISGVGTGTDWVGIYLPGAPHSIRWFYIDKGAHAQAPGSGIATDIRHSHGCNSGTYAAYVNLPAGQYVIRLVPNGGTDINTQIAWTTISIVPDKASMPATPLSLKYEIENPGDGFAKGKVTVTLPADKTSKKDIVMFWADANGKLKGYTPLAKFKVTGPTTTFEMPEGLLIPHGATRLFAYSASSTGNYMSESYAECPIPDGAASEAPGKPNFQFTVVSDIHIYADMNHVHNQHFKHMLEDVVKLTPDSIGVFIAGDMANSGNEIEYRNMMKLHNTVEGAPHLYLAIGNHDFYPKGSDMGIKIAQFLKYATYPDGSHPASCHYDFWLNDRHFIFLGNDRLIDGLYTTLSKETLAWLDKTLAEDYNPNKPAFIFLHQPLYNTCAGSLPGQNWNGVQTEKGFRDVLKKYPEAIMFNGHSHWTLDSESCMFQSNGVLPNIFNTAACGYLWTSYNKITGERLEGSQGYYVSVYDDKVLVSGRDFLNNEWVASAQFCVNYEQPETPVTTEQETTADVTTTEETTANTPTVPSETTVTPSGTTLEETKDSSEDTEKGCGSVIAVSSLALVVLGGFVLCRKKEN